MVTTVNTTVPVGCEEWKDIDIDPIDTFYLDIENALKPQDVYNKCDLKPKTKRKRTTVLEANQDVYICRKEIKSKEIEQATERNERYCRKRSKYSEVLVAPLRLAQNVKRTKKITVQFDINTSVGCHCRKALDCTDYELFTRRLFDATGGDISKLFNTNNVVCKLENQAVSVGTKESPIEID